MGCGRSTMGSDSPNDNSNKDEEILGLPATPTKTSQSNSVHSQVIPFTPGGPLLAQAKVSDSQMDFFKLLDEKIKKGPDFDSEEEEFTEKTHLQKCLHQWNKLTEDKGNNSSNAPLLNEESKNSPGISAEVLEESEDSWSITENISNEVVKEQYMFMGNLYTLTRLSSDGCQPQQHVVDISPAPPSVVDESCDTIAPISASVIPSRDSSIKINGTNSSVRKEEKGRCKLERADTPFHDTITPKHRIPPRPASLVLRTTVFPPPRRDR